MHEFPHLLSIAKTFDFNDPTQMPNVPLSVENHHGMGEGFAEALRWKYSASRNLFPEARLNPFYRYPSPMDYCDLEEALREKSIMQWLTTNDYAEAIGKVPSSILHHADKEGHYEYLIDYYNKFVRAIQSGQRGNEHEEYIDYLGNTITNTFQRKHHGGPIYSFQPSGAIPRYQSGGKIPGYGGGDRVPALLEAGEYVINKRAASRYHSVLDSINSDGIGRFATGGPVSIQVSYTPSIAFSVGFCYYGVTVKRPTLSELQTT